MHLAAIVYLQKSISGYMVQKTAVVIKRVLPLATLASVLLLIAQRASSLKSLALFTEKASFEIKSPYGFDLVGGILDGYFRFFVDIEVINPTHTEARIKKPYIVAWVDDNQVGFSEPSSEITTVPPNATQTIRGTEIKVRVMHLFPEAFSNLSELWEMIKNFKSNTLGKTILLVVSLEINSKVINKKFQYHI